MKRLAPSAAFIFLLSGCTVDEAIRMDETRFMGFSRQATLRDPASSIPVRPRKRRRPFISRYEAKDRLPAFPAPTTTNFSANANASTVDATPRMDPEILADAMDQGEPAENDTPASQKGRENTGSTATGATDTTSSGADSGSPTDSGPSGSAATDGDASSTGSTDTSGTGSTSSTDDASSSDTTGAADATGDGGATASDGGTNGTDGTNGDAAGNTMGGDTGGTASNGGADGAAGTGGDASSGADGGADASGDAAGGDAGGTASGSG